MSFLLEVYLLGIGKKDVTSIRKTSLFNCKTARYKEIKEFRSTVPFLVNFLVSLRYKGQPSA